MDNIIELSPYLPSCPARRASRCHAICTVIAAFVEGIVSVFLGCGILAGLIIGLSIL